MSIIVTGAAGFIGSNLVKALNRRGERDIIAVDDLTDGNKCRNLADCDIADYFDKREFVQRFATHQLGEVRAVLHQGACSSTVESDGRLMIDNNYRYSCDLLQACQEQTVPLLYASSAAVYGANREFREAREYEQPLNVYAYSKFLFDQRVRQLLAKSRSQIVGLRYFNVYGPREQHKGRMASMVWHCFNQYRDHGHVELFGEYGGYRRAGMSVILSRWRMWSRSICIGWTIRKPAAFSTWAPGAPVHSMIWHWRRSTVCVRPRIVRR